MPFAKKASGGAITPAKKIDDMALLQLLNYGGKNVKELAEMLGVGKDTMSKKLKRWKARGIAKISPGETLMKRRKNCNKDKIFILTKLGKHLTEASLHFFSTSLKGVDALPPSENQKQPLADPHSPPPSIPTASSTSTSIPSSSSPRRIPQSRIDEFAPRITDSPPPPNEIHGLCYRIPVEELGIYPPHLKEKSMKNWNKIYGSFMGTYIEFTTKSIFIWLNGVDETTDKVIEKCEEMARKVWIVLKHNYGWGIRPVIHRYNHTTGQLYNDIPVGELEPYTPNKLPKFAVLNAPEYSKEPSPQLGKDGEIDNTPNINTMHAPKSTIDVITENHLFFSKHRNEFANPADYTESLKQFVISMTAGIVDEAAFKAKVAVAHDLAAAVSSESPPDGETAGSGSSTGRDGNHPNRKQNGKPGVEVA